MSEQDLKPCPFCGGSACLQKGNDWGYFVECESCVCELGVAYCDYGGMNGAYVSKESAIAAWNTRADTTVPRVKPLVWKDMTDGISAKSAFGYYDVFWAEGSGWLAVLDGSDDSWVKYPDGNDGFERQHDAVSACNADNESRILSAIELAPLPPEHIAAARAVERERIEELIDSMEITETDPGDESYNAALDDLLALIGEGGE